MSTLYRTSSRRFPGEIIKVQADKVTKDAVVFGKHRRPRADARERYHPGFEKARSFLIKRAEQDINELERKLDRARNGLKIAQALKSPDARATHS